MPKVFERSLRKLVGSGDVSAAKAMVSALRVNRNLIKNNDKESRWTLVTTKDDRSYN